MLLGLFPYFLLMFRSIFCSFVIVYVAFCVHFSDFSSSDDLLYVKNLFFWISCHLWVPDWRCFCLSGAQPPPSAGQKLFVFHSLVNMMCAVFVFLLTRRFGCDSVIQLKRAVRPATCGAKFESVSLEPVHLTKAVENTVTH